MAADKVRCEACPVLCQISRGKLGACDRYGNVDGTLTRTDTVHLVRRAGAEVLEWSAAQNGSWDGALLAEAPVFVSGIGSGTTYPDYKPAPFIVASEHDGVDLVTVVTEGIFSYCSFKIKIDTDRYLGAEQSVVRHRGEAVCALVAEEAVLDAIDDSEVPITWEPLLPVAGMDAARAGEAPQLHAHAPGNVLIEGRVARGDLDVGLTSAAATAEVEVETTFVEHAYIEPEAGYARRVGDRIGSGRSISWSPAGDATATPSPG